MSEIRAQAGFGEREDRAQAGFGEREDWAQAVPGTREDRTQAVSAPENCDPSEELSEQEENVFCEAQTLHAILKWGEAFLKKRKIADASVDAWLLLEFVTKIGRAAFLAERRSQITEEQKQEYRRLIWQRSRHIPLQHLTGVQEFMGLTFSVSPHVLIPRQDTEVLVEEALGRLRPGMRVLDLCTGSGCIGISLARLGAAQCRKTAYAADYAAEKAVVTVDAADISAEALQTARKNAQILQAEVHFIESDLFSKIEGKYDMIVSNPPYIPTSVIEGLSEEVRLHEPFQALDGREDGLYFYRKIVEEGRDYLISGGWLLFEIGYDQGKAAAALLEAQGYKDIQIKKDLAGLDRVVCARWNGRCCTDSTCAPGCTGA